VFISLFMHIRDVRTPASGELVVEGLPYAARSASVLTIAADGVDATTRWEARTEPGTTRLRITTSTTAAPAPADAGTLRAGAKLTITGQYMV
jgi:hypothetical protein